MASDWSEKRPLRLDGRFAQMDKFHLHITASPWKYSDSVCFCWKDKLFNLKKIHPPVKCQTRILRSRNKSLRVAFDVFHKTFVRLKEKQFLVLQNKKWSFEFLSMPWLLKTKTCYRRENALSSDSQLWLWSGMMGGCRWRMGWDGWCVLVSTRWSIPYCPGSQVAPTATLPIPLPCAVVHITLYCLQLALQKHCS